MNMIQVRDELVQALGIPSSVVPFVAELMKVRDPEWEGAIEKLLHSFALRMLALRIMYADICKLLIAKILGFGWFFRKLMSNLMLSRLRSIKLSPINSFTN